MGKIVFWIVVFFVILLGLRFLNVAKSRERERQRHEPPKQLPPAEPTVRCEQCGVFLPEPEAIPTATGYRCGDPACRGKR